MLHLNAEDRSVFETFRNIIQETDTAVTEKVSKVMNIENALVYLHDDVFKYALAKTTRHFTFHSMVMYANPAIMEDLKSKLKKVKFQKGCINFISPGDFPADVFRELMATSAKCDYSAVIEHYRKKKK